MSYIQTVTAIAVKQHEEHNTYPITAITTSVKTREEDEHVIATPSHGLFLLSDRKSTNLKSDQNEEAAASSDTISERTEVIHGKQNVVNTVLQFTSNAKSRIDACVDYSRPSLAIEIEHLKKAFLDAKSRGVKLRYVTEVIENNIGYCKQLIKMVDELRHIEGIKGNFYISETEYIAPASLHGKGESASQIIYTNVKEMVEHQQEYVFDSFWSRAIPAERRIREIEEGIVQYETKVLENKEQIFNHMKSVIEKASERSVCSPIGGMQLIYNNFFDEYKKIIDRHRKRGEGKGVRWIISIDKDSIDLVKLFLNTGVQIRHVKNLTRMNFAVDNIHINATIDKMEGGKIMESLLTSNNLHTLATIILSLKIYGKMVLTL